MDCTKVTKEELDKIIDFLELRMIMRKAEGSELNFEETQLIKLCELCSDLTKENKTLQERIEYLERSNNRREETIELERKENLELHNKIDKIENKRNKAIEYINNSWTGGYTDTTLKYKVEEINITELLEILNDNE